MLLPVNGLYGHIQRNYLKSALLMAAFVVLAFAIWYAWCLLFTGLTFRPPRVGRVRPPVTLEMYLEAAAVLWRERWFVPVVLSAFWFAISFFFHSDMIRLGSGAREADRSDHARLYKIVDRLAITAGLPMPRVEVMPTDALNAYATGLFSDDAVVAVTQGLLDTLDDDELEAVIAHELVHIKNQDVRLMVVATIFAGGLALAGTAFAKIWSSGSALDVASAGSRVLGALARGGGGKKGGGSAAIAIVVIVLAIALMLLVKLLATLAQFALSRSREFLADAGAVELTKNPEALIRALRKISGADDIPRLAPQLRAMMFSSSAASLFSTHPPVEDRIQALVDHAGANPYMVEAAERRRSAVTARGDTAAIPAGAAAFAGGRATFGRRRARA